jgi:hypothetical protein
MKLKDWSPNGQHTSANNVPHMILWYGKKVSIALCVLTHTMSCLCLWGLGYSHGLASRERFQVSMRGWHQVFMIMADKGKFKITIPKDYMLEAWWCSHDGQVKMNTKQSFPYCVWGSYLKTSPMSCLQLEPRRNINVKLKWKAWVKGISSFGVSVVERWPPKKHIHSRMDSR